MARIAGVDLPRNKRIEIGLTYIYGIGKTSSQRILTKLNIDPDLKTDQLSDEEVSNIRKEIDSEYKVEGVLAYRNFYEHQTIDGSRITIADFGIVNRCRFVVSAPAPMHGRGRDRSGRLLKRKAPPNRKSKGEIYGQKNSYEKEGKEKYSQRRCSYSINV